MTILNKINIIDRIYSKNDKERLVITPLIDDQQIGSGTVDLRLGTSFIMFKSRKIDVIDPPNETHDKIMEYQEEVNYQYGKKFILQPTQFVLGCTLEYLKIPSDLLAYVVGRSSWGRLGLVIETSPIVQPCFIGVLTFELSNLGTAPIALYPGLRIAQLIFHKCKKSESKKPSKYFMSVSPSFTQISEEKDMNILRKLQSEQNTDI